MWTDNQTQQIIQLYQSNVTMTCIAKTFGVTIDKIRRLLITKEIYVKSKRYGINLPKKTIRRLYKQDLSITAIAKKYEVSTAPIVKIIQDIRKPNWLKTLSYTQMELVLDYEYVLNLVSTLISKTEISKQLNCGMDLTKSILSYHNLDLLNSAEVRSSINQQDKLHHVCKETFEYLHYDERLPQREIAKLMGISIGYLTKHVNRWNLVPIPGSELQLSDKFRALRDSIDVNSTLTNQIKCNTIPQLMDRYDACWDTIKNLLTKHSIAVPNRFRSVAEIELCTFIEQSYGGLVEHNIRNVIYPYELDIVLPELKIAIEYCGLYWHSELRDKNSKYHITKHNRCIEQGYTLITVFEDEWIHRRDCVQFKLKQLLGVGSSVKLNARQCNIIELTHSVKKQFLDDHHIQGNDISQHRIGLLYNNELVAVMTFSKPSRVRSNNNTECDVWELNRYATDSRYSVRGGAGKLLKYFQRNNKWLSIYSYADKRWSKGDMYHTLGFSMVHESVPNYWYYKPGNTTREYRYKYAKYKLVEQGFDSSKTEREIMKERGYTRVWDCGVMKFEMTAQ